MSAKSEAAERVDETSPQRGEGIIGRNVTLEVDDVLWSRESDSRAPAEIKWSASGWAFNEDGGLKARRPMTEEGTSRIEVGHSYVIAVKWYEALCTSGPDAEESSWGGLGADAVLPADGAVIGAGEYEGRIRSASAARSELREGEVDAKFGAQMIGRTTDELARALQETPPGKKSEAFVVAPNCD